jgi:hypothetical protein
VELPLTQTGMHQLRLVAESSTFTRSTAYLFQVVAAEMTTPAVAAREVGVPLIPPPVLAAAGQPVAGQTVPATNNDDEDNVGIGTLFTIFVVINVVTATAIVAVVLIRRQLRRARAARDNKEAAA